MADFPEHEPLEGLYSSTSSSRRRRVSYSSQLSSVSPLRLGHLHASSVSIRSATPSVADHSEIHSPVPRRHLLLQTEYQPQWLKDATLSPSPSNSYAGLRAGSPAVVSPLKTAPNASGSSNSSRRQNVGLEPHSARSARSNLKPVKAVQDIQHGFGRRWIKWMHAHGLRHYTTPVIILSAVWLKWCVGMGGYSGAGISPMFGDYEAQRHWMEITSHLPIQDWYSYDVQYWGLDYPPLTAYHSWVLGKLGHLIEPAWFALDSSRGIESSESKAFMRGTVLLSDAVIYIPALLLFISSWHRSRSMRTHELALITVLFHPSLILIDSGHFQFNSVMLGFTTFALYFLSIDWDLFGAVCFVFSMCFKQMALYYAPAIGCYLLGKCLYLGKYAGLRLFIRLAVTTLLSFYLVFLPFVPPFTSLSVLKTSINRIFPFSRGLFEDKVANFWCATDVVIKWRLRASTDNLLKLSTSLTALGFLPTVSGLLWQGYKAAPAVSKGSDHEPIPTPTLPLLPYALLTSSMSFFLFSFMVHEKTILLPLLPLILIGSGASTDSFTFQWIALVSNVASFSMWPLLKKDGLGVQYICCVVLWNWLIGNNPLSMGSGISKVQAISTLIYGVIITLHVLEATIDPPSRYPDLYAVLNVLVSTPIFVLTWLWSIKRELEISWALGGLQSRGQHKMKKG